MDINEKLGIVLLNTGSPDSPNVKDVRRYLRQFLSDPRVIDISPTARWFLLNFVILPFRPRASAEAYESIWTEEGSPLLVNSRAFRDRLQEILHDAHIEIGMAYGNPTIGHAVEKLLASPIDRLVVVPMFPQYASATTGSVLEAVYKAAIERQNVPAIKVVGPYYKDPGFLDAWAEVARPSLDAFKPDHILMSFHGLPERHIYKADPTGQHCLQNSDCCDNYRIGNPNCYRAHCLMSGKGIAERLGLKDEEYTVCFQSKLGRDPWLTPATDEVTIEAAKTGVKKLAIISPAFVADCIETLEELGIRGKEDFLEHGGQEYLMVPSLNSHPRWVTAMADIIRRL